MLVIYNPHPSPRADYVFRHVFEECLKLPYSVVHSPAEAVGEAVLNYSAESLGERAVQVLPDGLLSETGISAQPIEVVTYDGHSVFFATTGRSDLPYDPFSAIFYLLSRYEEYLPFAPDPHGRFSSGVSIAAAHGLLLEPLADQAVNDVRKLLSRRFPALEIAPPAAQIAFSYDIDAPFAFHGKGWARNFFGAVAAVLRGQFRAGALRLRWLIQGGQDPFDVFEALLQMLEARGVKARFFLLLEHMGGRNPMIDPEDGLYRQRIARIAAQHPLGIHPSYHCADLRTLQREMQRFFHVTGDAARMSRQHFLRLRLPSTYRDLAAAGIAEDHSMGFADAPGFRAGTAIPFSFYDLEKEEILPLRIHPFCFMDATFEYYQKASGVREIQAACDRMLKAVRQTGGTFSAVFHNDLLSEYPTRIDWAQIHRGLLEVEMKGSD